MAFIADQQSPPRSADWWHQVVAVEERRGELLTAFDLAERGLAEQPDDRWLKHRAVLALARAGATAEAARRFEAYGLGGSGDEDVAALEARIVKDLALASPGSERRRAARRAAENYGAVFARTAGYYPAINEATLWLVAGERKRAEERAAAVLGLVDRGEDSYYAAATRAEAHLLRDEEVAAGEALAQAATLHGGDYAALATTRRQLRLICELRGIDPEILSVLAGPSVVHFCGHRIGDARFPGEMERAVAARITKAVAQRPGAFGYGSLAAGSDILWAEALLARGNEVHVVLPFARDEFIARSVAPSGSGWITRFRRCLTAAASVRYATEDAFLGDDVLFRYGSELAMGLALLRARYLDSDAHQLAVWDGQPADGAAGTAIDIATWRRAGRSATVVWPDGAPVRGGPAQGQAPPTRGGRIVRAMLFGDMQGFSKLTDEQLLVFSERVLGACAAVLGKHHDEIGHRNTWGDALYVVLTDAASAAACALDLQDAMAGLDLAAAGLPAHLALRLGAHLGPVFPVRDPVLDEDSFMGSHVSRTARIEPVTPPGAVYVTEPFAAALVLGGPDELTCDYVGHMPAAKDYGPLRMYRLRRSLVRSRDAGS